MVIRALESGFRFKYSKRGPEVLHFQFSEKFFPSVVKSSEANNVFAFKGRV